MADEIETKIHELQSTAEQKQQFIDNLAHELRTPLTTIRGYAEYLKNANINEDDKTASVDYIVSEAVRIEEMAVKLLDLALLRNNALEAAEIDILYLFCVVTQKLSPLLTEKNIRLETDYRQSFIIGDRVLLESLLFNLLNNAIKASNKGMSIFLSNTTENGNCTVIIQDFGKGMTEENIAKLTEPFYRADKARSRSEGDAGLGLALCEQIAELHRAKLVFSSEVGKGTTVKISFTNP
jgi:signal transduction histidine kinase